MKNILEYGSSSLLDFDWNEGWNKETRFFNVIKTFHKHKPKYYDELVDADVMSAYDFKDIDILVISSGLRDTSAKVDCIELSLLIQTNIMNQVKLINRFMETNGHGYIYYLGSVSADEDKTYYSRPIYASCKAFMRKYLQNMNIDVLEFVLDSTKSNMCNHGDNPEKFRKIFLNKLYERILPFSKYQQLRVCDM